MVAHFRSFPAFVAAGIFASATQPAQADDDYPESVAEKAEQLEALTQWGLDYSENKCRLARIFGSEQDRHLLMIEQASPSDAFTLTFAGSSFRRYRRGDRVFLGLQNDNPMRRIELPPTGNLGDFGPAIIVTSIDVGPSSEGQLPNLRRAGLDPLEGAKIDRIVIERSGKVLAFETGNLKEAFAALNTCTEDLLDEWGLDTAAHRSFVPVKWLNESEIVRRIVRRYPVSALNRGEQANFSMRVIVDEGGNVADCQIDAATEADRLDSPACQEMQLARFEPAIDAAGKPMRSFYATTIRYEIAQ